MYDPYTTGTGYVSKVSAVNTSTATTKGSTRLSKSNNNYVYIPGKGAPVPSAVAFDDTEYIQTKPGTTQTQPEDKYKKVVPLNYKWNLLPHDWSLPFRPIQSGSEYVGNDVTDNFHGLRRGRIWFWDAANSIENLGTDGKTSTADATKIASSEKTIDATTDRYWGFQFLWNPETVQSNVARNMDITPSSADSLRVVSGAFPGQETFTVNLVLDRVNDFACARATNLVTDGNGVALTTNLDRYQKYYTSQEYPNADTSITFSEKFSKVLAQGTMADLEYLFRAINGTLKVGGVSREWNNLLGKKTANIGYLQPSLMGFQFGPSLDNLAWVGWISNLSINHTMFTENMIPLRTEVTISAEAFTGSGVGSA